MGGQGGGTPPDMGGGYAPGEVIVITLYSNASWELNFI